MLVSALGLGVLNLDGIPRGRVHVTPGWLSPELTARLRKDAANLWQDGAFRSRCSCPMPQMHKPTPP